MSTPNEAAPASTPAPAPAPRPRRLRKWLIRGGIVAAVLLVLLVLLTPVLVNVVVRPIVVSTLRDYVNGEPAIDRLSFSWFSGLEVEGVRIGNPPGFSSGPCVSVERVTADVSLPSLLVGHIVLKEPLRVVKPKVAAEVNDKGEANLALLAKPQPPAPKKEAGALPYVEAALKVEDFVLTLKTPNLAQPAALAPIGVEARVDTLDKPVTFGVRNGDGSLEVKGNLLVAQGGKIDPARMKGELDYVVPPAFLAPLMPALASAGPVKKLVAAFSGKGHFGLDGLARGSGRGDVTVDVPEVTVLFPVEGGPPVARTLRPGALKVSFELKPRGDGMLDLEVKFDSAAASMALKGAASPTADVPAIEAELSASADLAELAKRFPGIIGSDRRLQGRIVGGLKKVRVAGGIGGVIEADLDLRGEKIVDVGPDGAPTPVVNDLAARLHLAFDMAKGTWRMDGIDFHVDDLLQTSGHVRVEGLVIKAGQTLTPADMEKLANAASIDADVKATADLGALLAKARQFVPGLIPKALAVAGRTEARLQAARPASGQTVSPFSLEASIRGLKASGIAALEGVEIPAEASAAVKGQFDFGKDWSVALEKARLDSPVATVQASGGAAHLRTQPEGTLTARVEALPGALGAMLAKRLGGIALNGQAVVVSLQGGGGPDKGTFEVTVTAPVLDLAGLPGPVPAAQVRNATFKLAGGGTHGWKAVDVTAVEAAASAAPPPEAGKPAPAPTELKLAARAKADLASGKIELPDFKASLSGAMLTMSGSATLPPAPAGSAAAPTGGAEAKPAGTAAPAPPPLGVDLTVDGAVDVKALLATARAWRLPVEDLDGGGTASLHVKTTGTTARLKIGELDSKLDVHVAGLVDAAGHAGVKGLVVDADALAAPDGAAKLTAGVTADIDVKADANVESLLARAAKLGIALPVAVTGPPVSVVLKAGGGGEKGTFDLAVNAPSLDVKTAGPAGLALGVRSVVVKVAGAGTDGWRKIAVTTLETSAGLAEAGAAGGGAPLGDVKMSAAASADLGTGTYGLTDLKASLAGATVSGGLSVILPPAKPGATDVLGQASVSAALDVAGQVKPLLALCRAWKLPVEDLDGEGDVSSRLEASGTLARVEVKRVRGEVKGLALAGKLIPKEIRWPVSFAAEASLALSPLDLMGKPAEITAGSARGPGLEVQSLKGSIALAAPMEKTELEMAGTLDPQALAAVAPGFLQGMTVASGAGPMSLRVKGPEIALTLELPATSFQGGPLPAGGVAVGPVAAEFKARIDPAKYEFHIARAHVRTDPLAFDARGDLALETGGGPDGVVRVTGLKALEGHSEVIVSLGRLRPLVLAFSGGALPADTELAGDINLTADVKAAGGAFPFTAQVAIPGLHFKNGMTRNVPIDEPEWTLKLAGAVAQGKNGIDVTLADGSSLTMKLARATLKGAVRGLPAAPAADGLAADVTYEPSRVNPFLKAFQAGEMPDAAPQPVRFSLSGPLLPGADLLAWLAKITMSAQLGYGAYANTGVKVEGSPMALELKDGKLPVDYACKVNAGATTMKGLVDFTGGATTYALSAQDVGLNADMAPILGRFNPIFHLDEKGTIEGQASADLDATWTGRLPFPLPAPAPGAAAPPSPPLEELIAKQCAAKGKFSAKNLKIAGSPLLMSLVGELVGTDTGQVGDVQPTDFALADGVLSYSNMVTHLGGMELVFSGKINVDQSLEMQIVAPFPSSLRQQHANLDKYIGPTIVIPLKGKVSDPKPDTKKAIELALKEAGEAYAKDQAKKAVGDKAGDVLKGLPNPFKKRKGK